MSKTIRASAKAIAAHFIYCLALLFFLTFFPSFVSSKENTPLKCQDPGSSCLAYLYYRLPSNGTLEDARKLFRVEDQNITVQNYSDPSTGSVSQGLYVKVSCSCSSSKQYFAHSSFVVEDMSSSMGSIAENVYNGLAWTDPTNNSEVLQQGVTIDILLLCGCPDRINSSWQYYLTYDVVSSDILKNLADRFESTVQAIKDTTGITDVTNIFPDEILYIPVNSTIGSAVDPTFNPPVIYYAAESKRLSSGAITGIVSSVLMALLVGLGLFYVKQKRSKFSHYLTKHPPRGKHRISKSGLLSCTSCSNMFSEKTGMNRTASMNENAKRRVTLPRDMMSDVLYFERPVAFSVDEIEFATNNFSSRILGQGLYGTVYHGVLRDQEVAIRRIQARKNPEIVAEIKSLCKLHHTSLVELIGYSSNENEVHLVYEFAENGIVGDHLHHFLRNGLTPLTWNTRMQIALDAARGLDYIHEHTRVHYVHCDVNTSSIFLDANLRAKVANFGLAKLMKMAKEVDPSENTEVGSPEHQKTCDCTTKSDVYSFGVVLFELVTGREEILGGRRTTEYATEQQSLIKEILPVIEDHQSPMSMSELRSWADPSLSSVYPSHIFHRVCVLGKRCVKDDPASRPSMKEIVYTLSQILLESIEWEATLAGDSQVFSGLTHGR